MPTNRRVFKALLSSAASKVKKMTKGRKMIRKGVFTESLR